MKSEREIRAFRNDVLTLLQRPCTCTNPIQKLVCEAQKRDIQSRANLLSWVLGENYEFDKNVEEISAEVRK